MPYKIERLKPIYLFILLTTIFTLGLFTEKTLIQTVFSKKERTEEIMVGDVNETMNYSFEVVWDDKDYETNRPTSVTYNLYNVLDENTIVSTVTLTSANVDNNDTNKWVGTFNDIRKYNDDESLAEYIIKTDYNFSDYLITYNKTNYNGLCIKFGDNVFNGDPSKKVRILGSRFINSGWQGWSYFKNNDSNDYYYSDLSGKTMCVPINMNTDSAFWYFERKAVFFEGDIYNLNIEYIYPTDKSEYGYVYDGGKTFPNIYDIYSGDNYPNNNSKEVVKYKWVEEGISYNFPQSNVIRYSRRNFNLNFDKYWDDDGYETNRPSSSEFYLYRKDDQNSIIKTVTLTSTNADVNDSSHWLGVFNNIPKYDSNGKIIEYVVREKAIPNYVNSYDSEDGITIKINEQSDIVKVYTLNMIYCQPIGENCKKIVTDVERESSHLGEFIAGLTIKISPKNDDIKFKDIYEQDWNHFNSYAQMSDLHSVQNLINNEYPENIHPFKTGDSYGWHYKHSLSKQSGEFYLSFDSASWGPGYGLKIDEIATYGNETIITSTINLTEIEITKIWEDEEDRSFRPTKTTIDIYNEKNPNVIVRTIEITNSDSTGDYTWKKKVSNLPKYNEDLTECKYLFSERKVDNYKSIYDVDWNKYNGLAVTFSEDSNGGPYIGFVDDQGQFYYVDRASYGFTGSSDYHAGHTISVKAKNVRLDLSDYVHRLKITNIVPTIVEYDFFKTHTLGGTPLPRETFNNYVEYNESMKFCMWDYEWNGSLTPIEDGYIIKNRLDRTSYEFTKQWDDAGNEDGRPESIRYNIFNEKDENNVVKTVSITGDSENPNNRYEWNAVATGLPKYNDDGSLARYIAKEEILDKYKTDYDNEYNSVCIKFGNEVFNDDDTRTLNFFVKKRDSYEYHALKNKNAVGSNNPEDFYKLDLQNKEVCLPLYKDSNDFYLYSLYYKVAQYIIGGQLYSYEYETVNLMNLNIIDIYKKHTTEDYEFVDNGRSSELFSRTKDNFDNMGELPDVSDTGRNIHYTWIDDNPYGKQIITNHANMREEGYIKEFHDTGYEYNRPKEIVFGLYVENDPIPKEMVTVNTSMCINNKCNIEFKNVRDKDNDNNPINYIIKEISDYGYDVTYENDKVINTANPVEVKFRKENIKKELLSGAKFEIYNKSNEKIYEFTSTNSETKVKLLPSSYTIKEVTPPEGYTRSNDINFIVNKDGTITINDKTESVVSIVNEPVKSYYDITLKKTMEGNDNKEFTFEVNIEGVEDPLEYTGDRTGTITNGKGTFKLGANQTITIKNIPAASKYEIKELENDYEVEIVGESKGTLDRNETIEFINTPKEEPYVPDEKEEPTPITGLYNITTYIIGILLLIASIFLIVYSKKQITKKEIN